MCIRDSHFGDRAGMIATLFDHLAEREGAPIEGGPAAALQQLLGPGRTLTLARYELFLMAVRDATLRPPLIRARDRFVAAAAERVGATAAPAFVAAMDGLVLDALVRGDQTRTGCAWRWRSSPVRETSPRDRAAIHLPGRRLLCVDSCRETWLVPQLWP